MIKTSLKRVRRGCYQILASMTGSEAIGKHTESDVFVVGFPKSGNTWFQYLVAGVMTGVDVSIASDLLIQNLVPDIYAERLYHRYYHPMLFKSHELPTPTYRRVIYLLRDGRDAMVSYYHHLAALHGQKFSWETMIRDAPGLPAPWHSHVDAWMQNPYKSEVLVVRYEDLKKDGLKELKRVTEFLRLEVPESRLISAVEAASFTHMREREQKQGWADPSWPKDKPFVRKGKVGSYKEEMPAEALALFMKQASRTLRAVGYDF